MQRLAADAVDAARVGIDAIVAVHESLEAQQMAVERERHRSELDQAVGVLARGLAVQGDVAQQLQGRVERRPRDDRLVVGVVQ